MKKLLSLFLLVALLASLAVPALAADAKAIVPAVADATAEPGQEVTLTLTLPEEVKGIGAGKITVSVSDGLTLVDGEWLIKDKKPKPLMADFKAESGRGVFAYTQAAALSGDIFAVTVKVPENASAGATYRVLFQLGLTDKASVEDLTVETVTASVRLFCTHSSYEKGWTSDATYHWHACSSCGEADKKVAHVYDNACDTTCNVCGYTRKTTHQFSGDWNSDSTGHWQTCKVCGAKTDTVAHTPGAPATEKTAQTCTVCGFVLKPALAHTHVYSTDWSKNTTYHWHACTGCDGVKDKVKHIYDSSCDTTCNACGYVRTITHSYSSWTRDGSSHWHVCSVCGKVADKNAHVYDNSCDATCNTCGYVREVTHTWKKDYQSDAEGHWNVCSVCGIASIKSAHTPLAPATETAPSVCSACAYVIAPATGHTFSEWTVTTLPTTTEDGVFTRTCACGETETRPFPKLPAELAPFADRLTVIFTPEELAAIADGASYNVFFSAEPTEIAGPSIDGHLIGYYKLAFYKTIGSGDPIAVDNLSEPTSVVLTVPEADRNTDPDTTRTYRAALISNGTVTGMIDGVYDEEKGTFTFTSNGNTVCALLYTDEVHHIDPPPQPHVDSFPDGLLYGIIGVAAAAGISVAAILFFKKKKES